MAKIAKRDLLTAVTNKVSLINAWEGFMLSRKSVCAPATLRTYADQRDWILSGFQDAGIQYADQLTASILREMLADYGASHSAGGVSFRFRHLRAFVNFVWDEYDIDAKNPMSRLKIKTPYAPPKEGITRAEIELIHKAIKHTSKFPERDAAIIDMLADTGIRRGSLISIKMADLDMVRSRLTVYEKDQRYHYKAFGTETAKALRAYLSCLIDINPTDPLWLNQDGSEMTTNSIRMMIQRMCDAAGIHRHQFHDFRRFYGLELYRQTHDIYFVSRMLDHKDVEVTKRYLAIDTIEDAEAARLVSPMDLGKRKSGKIQRPAENLEAKGRCRKKS